MSFDKEIHRIAYEKIRLRRQTAEQQADRKKELFYEKEPKAKMIDARLKGAAFSVFEEVLCGALPSENAELQLVKARQDLIRERDALYKKHRVSEKDFLPKYVCSKCEDTGYINGTPCRCFRNMLIRTAAELSNLPDDTNAVFKNFDASYYSDVLIKDDRYSPRQYATIALCVCQKFADHFSDEYKNLYIYGEVGLGKTFLSSCIAHELLKKGVSVLYQSSGSLFKLLTDDAFGKTLSDRDAYIVARAHDADLLIIDDFGTEFITEYTKTAIFQLLNERICSKKSMIINSNVSLDKLRTLYTDRIFSRLTGAFMTVFLAGSDIRQQQKKQQI